MSIWICGWMNYVELDMWMLCMDVNVMFMNIVNVYIYTPSISKCLSFFSIKMN
jgi:hypothetical protein